MIYLLQVCQKLQKQRDKVYAMILEDDEDDGDYGDDSQAASFINDPNYPVYEELCRKYGFKIDKNIPPKNIRP